MNCSPWRSDKRTRWDGRVNVGNVTLVEDECSCGGFGGVA